MIIAVSIVDKHKPAGKRHIGTYHFEVPYDGNSHFDLFAAVCPVENEWIFKNISDVDLRAILWYAFKQTP